MKQKKTIIFTVLGLVILGFVLWGIFSNKSEQINTNDNNTVSDKQNSNNNETNNSKPKDKHNSSSTTDKKDTSDKGKQMEFPFTATNDQLVIEGIYDYSGYYIEDGSESEVENVAAIKVTNTADTPIEYVKILIKGKDKTLCFEVSLLPSNESAIVMESNKQSYITDETLLYDSAQIAYINTLDKLEDKVAITVNDKNGITLKNISNEPISQLRVFYKSQIESGEYIGGIAYTVKLEDLKPEEEKTVYPSHFITDTSKVMMVRIYE